jgi:hypothetical protein
LCAGAALSYAVATVVPAAGAGQDLDYTGYYAKGITFAAFLDGTRSQRDEWRSRYNDAAVTADLMTRMRALPDRRRILVVAEDWCVDSANTIPYIARLVDGAPERLEMRVIDSTIGAPVMQAHRTPDGRASTPTVVVFGEDGHLIGAWVERPSALQAWRMEEKTRLSRHDLRDRTGEWYTQDAGKSTMAEIAALAAK